MIRNATYHYEIDLGDETHPVRYGTIDQAVKAATELLQEDPAEEATIFIGVYDLESGPVQHLPVQHLKFVGNILITDEYVTTYDKAFESGKWNGRGW